jgi:hypothetical protein
LLNFAVVEEMMYLFPTRHPPLIPDGINCGKLSRRNAVGLIVMAGCVVKGERNGTILKEFSATEHATFPLSKMRQHLPLRESFLSLSILWLKCWTTPNPGACNNDDTEVMSDGVSE